MTILVLDDDAALRGALSELLRLEGHRVLQADDGTRALALARVCHLDAVLLDPETVLHGRRCLARLRADPALSGIALVVMSAAEPDAPDAVFLAKPFTFDGVLAALGHATGRSAGPPGDHGTA
ncbi:MAG TPA: response regulator [Anaeromyxobacteraceae bacterium]|nr:response regulator [Anaeromyxobacteraceae bacterium]